MDEEYLETVLDVVAEIPAGRASTYGDVAVVVARELGRGGPRQVGAILALAGAGVPWWRVVDAQGRPPARHLRRALDLLAEEGCPLRGGRVLLSVARWTAPGDDGLTAGR